MPQRDTLTYLPQVFWLVLIFFTYFIIVRKNILPVSVQILKSRLKTTRVLNNLLVASSAQVENCSNLFAVNFDGSSELGASNIAQSVNTIKKENVFTLQSVNNNLETNDKFLKSLVTLQSL